MSPNHSPKETIATSSLTLLALMAFATNSILCRAAFTSTQIGPVEFTLVRLLSGAFILSPFLLFGRASVTTKDTTTNYHSQSLSWKWAIMSPSIFLFSYALCFSLAYVYLGAGTGALILFATVQLTMMGGSIYRGRRVAANEWAGACVAFLGLVYLLLPGLTAPPLLGTLLMIVAGASWGIYSLIGSQQSQPVLATARNFLFCLPGCFILVLVLLWRTWLESNGPVFDSAGLALACLSGALASGMGYVIWYMALKKLTVTSASVAQLSVPVLAGIGGVIFLHERPSVRLAIAAALIVGGIFMSIAGRGRRK